VRVFEDAKRRLQRGDDAGWDALLQRLYRLGYARVDVVSAAGEYAVRGGILDVFPATADLPVRSSSSATTLESIRQFDVQSQRSTPRSTSSDRAVAGDPARRAVARERAGARDTAKPNVVSALRAYLAGGADVPEPWLAWPTTSARRARLSRRRALVVLEEPGMLATIERGLDEERSRASAVLLAGVDSGELDVRDDEVGEALLAERGRAVSALERHASARRAPRAGRSPADRSGRRAVAAAREGRSCSRRIRPSISTAASSCSRAVREWVAAGDTVWLTATGASRLAEIVRAPA
jgi:hypothetical protein